MGRTATPSSVRIPKWLTWTPGDCLAEAAEVAARGPHDGSPPHRAYDGSLPLKRLVREWGCKWVGAVWTREERVRRMAEGRRTQRDAEALVFIGDERYDAKHL